MGKVQRALAHGLFCNAARFEKTLYSATEKHHTGTDVYSLVHNTGPGLTPPTSLHCFERARACKQGYLLRGLALCQEWPCNLT